MKGHWTEYLPGFIAGSVSARYAEAKRRQEEAAAMLAAANQTLRSLDIALYDHAKRCYTADEIAEAQANYLAAEDE